MSSPPATRAARPPRRATAPARPGTPRPPRWPGASVRAQRRARACGRHGAHRRRGHGGDRRTPPDARHQARRRSSPTSSRSRARSLRQALNQFSRDRLVTLEPRAARASPNRASTRHARCSRCATCSRQRWCAPARTDHAQVAELRAHLRDEGTRCRAPTSADAAARRLPRRARAHARQRGAGADAPTCCRAAR